VRSDGCGGSFGIATLNDIHNHDVLVLVAATVLGAGYGFFLVAGLLEVQCLADPDDLAGLNAVSYVLTYVDFSVPVALAELDHLVSYPVLLLCLARLAAVSLMVVATQSHRSPVAHRQGAPLR
jgi:hypothetical protein